MSKAISEQIVSRRSILRAAAWTVPAVAVAVATPALAASGDAGPEAAPIAVNPAASPVLAFSNFVWKWVVNEAYWGRLSDQPVPYALTTLTQLAIVPAPGVGNEALRAGQATVRYDIKVVDSSGTQVAKKDYVVLPNQDSWHNSGGDVTEVIGVPRPGKYTVTWTVTAALDSDRKVIAPTNSSVIAFSKVFEVSEY